MATYDIANKRTPSTTWERRLVKIDRRPAAPAAARERSERLKLSARARRQPTTLTLRYRGGSESWWEIKARGATFRAPGWLVLQDVMEWILNPDH